MSERLAALLAEARELGVDVSHIVPEYAMDAEEKEEKEVTKTLDLLREAEELGIDPDLLERYKEEKLGGYRKRLEGEQKAADANRGRAAYNLDATEDTALENLGQGAHDMTLGLTRFATDTLDFLTSPMRVGGTEIAKAFDLVDEDAPYPSWQRLAGVEGRELKSQEPFVQDVTYGIGQGVGLGMGFVPVARAAGATSSVMADIAGLGMSTEAGVAGALGRGGVMSVDDMDAVIRQGLDNTVSIDNLTQLDLTNKYQVGYWAEKVNAERAIQGNINVLEEAEVQANKKATWELKRDGIDAKILEAEEAGDDKLVKKLNKKLAKEEAKFIESYAPPKAEDTLVSSLRTIEEMAERFGESPADIAKAISRAGGIEVPPSLENLAVRHKSNMSKLFDDAANGGLPNWFERIGRPTSRIVSKYISTRAGSQFEKAFENAARESEKLFTPYAADVAGSTAVREWAERPEVKAAFLNLRFTGKKGMDEILKMADQSLDKAGRGTFARLLKDTEKYNTRAKRLYKGEALQDEVYWASAIKSEADKAKPIYSRDTAPTGIAGANVRKRGLIEPSEADKLAQYENPMIAQLNRIAGDENLIQLTEKFNLRPSVGLRDNTDDFFKSVQQQLEGTASAQQVQKLSDLMQSTVEGSRKSPSLPIRIYMKQAYAGTLGQFDSALLNLHDISVSAWHNGAMPTGKAVVQRLLRNGEFSLRELGMTNDATSLEEFRAGFDKVVSKAGTIEGVVDQYSNIAFKYSTFQTMDRFGKSITLQAAKNAMEASAKKGTLVKDFGYLLDPRDLGVISRALKAGKRLDEMTPAQQAVMEEAMFARLGEQQLISMAGRPLTYLQNPNYRFLWAMSGFAIKQADLLWEKVAVQVAQGNLGKAGAAMAGYLAWVALGYGVYDGIRKLPSHMITGDEKTAFTVENTLARAGSQVASVATLNKLGDEYSLNQALADPVGFAWDSAEPPGGLVGNVGKDIGRALNGKEFKAYFLRSVPMGETLYDIWNSQ